MVSLSLFDLSLLTPRTPTPLLSPEQAYTVYAFVVLACLLKSPYALQT